MTVQKHNDATGWKRGLGAYSKDDPEFDAAKKHKYDSFAVQDSKEYSLIDDQVDQPAGKLLGGGGPVSHNKRTAGPPKFKAKRGPIGNMEKPK